MSNRLFQGLLPKFCETAGGVVGIIDEDDVIIACGDLARLGDTLSVRREEVVVADSPVVLEGRTYGCLDKKGNSPYIVFIESDDALAAKHLVVIAAALSCIEDVAGERYDRQVFVKNIILDNVLPGDVFLRTRELRFDAEVPRTVLVVRSLVPRDDLSMLELIQGLFPDKSKDFVIYINETDVVVVKEVRAQRDLTNLEKLARSIADVVNPDYDWQPVIGVGSTVESISEIAQSYKEAQVALEVAKVFDSVKKVSCYDRLGIARLIYQLPKRLCGMFLGEIFKRGGIETLDSETLFTIQKFFENNLNVSETSRRLFIHRNTLVYRLEKIKKLTGLDLREFDDAIVFKVALMVQKYLDAQPVRY